MIKKILAILMIYLIPITSFAATIELINGTAIEGDLIETTNGYIMIKLGTYSNSFPVKFYKEELSDVKISKSEKRYPLTEFTEKEILEGAVSRLTDIFYLDPNTDLLVPHLNFLLTRNPKIVAMPGKWDHLSHFYATAFQNNKDGLKNLSALARKLSFTSKKAIEKLIKDIKNYKPIEKPNDPKDLDFLWAEFIATGKATPVQKIINVLNYGVVDFSLNTSYWKQYEIPEKELALEALQESAKWSLEANAKKHKRVYGIIKEYSEQNESKELKEILRRTKVKITEQNWIEELFKRAQEN